MKKENTILIGDIRDNANNGLQGIIVRIIDRGSQDIFGLGITGISGRYRMKLDSNIASQIFENKGDILIEVVDGKDNVLSKRKSLSLKLGDINVLDWKIDETKLQSAEPFLLPLKKCSGSLIDQNALNLIDSAVKRIIPRGETGYNRFLRAAKYFIPPLSQFENLLDICWAIIEGDISSGHQLRGILKNYIEGSNEKFLSEYSLEKILPEFGKKDNKKKINDNKKFLLYKPQIQSSISRNTGWRTTEPRIVQLNKLLPLYIATSLISKDQKDSNLLQGAILKGLSGIGTMTRLIEAAKNTYLGGSDKIFKGYLNEIARFSGDDDSPLTPYGPQLEMQAVQSLPQRFEDYLYDQSISNSLMWLRKILRLLAEELETYYILDVKSCFACPGETITISGGGWGYPVGKVCFSDRNSVDDRICVDPVSWDVNEIKAVVPADAGNGPITLKILEEVITTSEGTVEIYKEGTFHGNTCPPPQDQFVGGAPSIIEFTVNGSVDDRCWPPDSDVYIAWTISPRYAVHTRLLITDGTTTYLDQDSLEPVDAISFHTPALLNTVTLDITLTTYNMCSTVSETRKLTIMPYRQLRVEGIELTQGIQIFDLNDVQIDFLGQGGVNDLEIISNKDTIVRVYVSADLGGFNNDEYEVTGELTIDGINLAPINGTSPTTLVGNPIITARNRAVIDREQTDHTLNFRIPAALCQGTKQFTVSIFEATPLCSPGVQVVQPLTCTWKSKSALSVRYVRITDNRPAPAGTGNTPTNDECEFTLERAFDILPFSADIAPASLAILNTTHDFTTDAGLQDLLDDLDDERDCSAGEWISGDCQPDNNILWVGFTEPFNRGMAKRPGLSAISAIYELADGQGDMLRIKTAHEISHTLGFKHVNRCCGAGCTAPGGPHYDHPNNGNLQEVPFDPFWNEAIAGTLQDFMSYGCDRWISEENWPRLEQSI